MNGRFRAAAPPHVRVLDRPQWADQVNHEDHSYSPDLCG
jgi:hypothetical protein